MEWGCCVALVTKSLLWCKNNLCFPLRPGSTLSHCFFIDRVTILLFAVFQVSPSLSGFSFSLQMDLTPLYIKKDISSLHPSFFFLFLHNLSSFLKGCVYVCMPACVCVGGGVPPEGNIRDPWSSYMQLLTAWLGCCDLNLQQLWALVTAEPSLQLLHPDSWCGSLYSLFPPPHR